MIRHVLLIGTATLALATGAAFAQSVTTETTTTKSVTTAPLPPVAAPQPPTNLLPPPAAPGDSTTQSKTERSVDSYGRETSRSESYRNQDGRVEHRSSTTIRDSDGALQSEQHEEWRQAPTGTTSTTTTTRTDRRSWED